MIRDIYIRPVLNGFLIKVGCQYVVFDDRDKMVDNLMRYLLDPERVEKEWTVGAMHAKHLLGAPAGIAAVAPPHEMAGAEINTNAEIGERITHIRQMMDELMITVEHNQAPLPPMGDMAERPARQG